MVASNSIATPNIEHLTNMRDFFQQSRDGRHILHNKPK
ncbi:MAG: hypothetical protein ACI9C3_002854 [Yoonia sp.]